MDVNLFLREVISMDDADSLFAQGITLLREKKDVNEARRLLLQSIRLNPNNDMAWVWLSRAVKDPVKRRECLKRALVLNPDNQHARTLLDALDAKAAPTAPMPMEEPPAEEEASPALDNHESASLLDEAPASQLASASVWIDTPETREYLEATDSFELDLEPEPAQTPEAALSEADMDEYDDTDEATAQVMFYDDEAEDEEPAPVAFYDDEAEDEDPASVTFYDDEAEAEEYAEDDFVETPAPPKQPARKLDDKRQIARHLKQAEAYLKKNDEEGAITEWVRVLQLEYDHEVAMREAVRHLSRLRYIDDARELVWRALNAGTSHPSIYLTAIDIARHQGNHAEADDLRERFCRLGDVDDARIVEITDYFVENHQVARAQKILERVLEQRPRSQRVMTALGDLHESMDNHIEAMRYYDRAARMGAGTREGREADKRLSNYAPIITDRERGSRLLAWRETLGIGFFFLLLAWQDAGLNLLALGPRRWIGLALSLLGGYLLVTATSSPQQQAIGRLLGGSVPDSSGRNTDAQKGIIEEETALPIISPAMRFLVGIAGAALLIVAVALVFGTALSLLLNPVPPTDIPTLEDILLEALG